MSETEDQPEIVEAVEVRPAAEVVLATSPEDVAALEQRMKAAIAGDIQALPVQGALQARLADLADHRWRKEVGGMVLNDQTIATDRDTQSKLSAVYFKAKLEPDFSVNWKAAPGTFVTLPAAQIIAIGDAVSAHVQACFDREAALSADLVAASKKSGSADVKRKAIAAVDITAGWPS